jgi:hypothetical protein
MLLRNANGVPLYAFAGTKGRVCFNVWGGGGTCGVIDRSHDALWVVNGGRAVAGVVSDRVHAVEISLGGAFVRVPVRHNAFVLPFRMRPGEGLPQPTVIPVVR